MFLIDDLYKYNILPFMFIIILLQKVIKTHGVIDESKMNLYC